MNIFEKIVGNFKDNAKDKPLKNYGVAAGLAVGAAAIAAGAAEMTKGEPLFAEGTYERPATSDLGPKEVVQVSIDPIKDFNGDSSGSK